MSHNWCPSMILAWAHTQGAVQTDGLTIEHDILDNMPRQSGVFVGSSQAFGKGHSGAQRLPGRLWQASDHGSIEDTGRDGHNANTVGGELAGKRQGHTSDSGFGSRVGRLANLAFKGGDRRSVDDNPTLALSIRSILHHEDGCQTYDIERADQVNLDHPRKAL